jgi:DNA modification methylase
MNVLNQEVNEKFSLYNGDSVEVLKGIPDNSIHYSIFSPPFASLYTYSNSDRDMGNSKTDDEFYEHFTFLVKELYRVTMPGRLLSFHCMNLPTSKVRDGVIGIKDFRGLLIRIFTDAGWVYHSEVCIWKNPVTAMQRTKALGLLWKQLKKDSAMSRQGIPDFIVTMRKPGDNPERVTHTDESFPCNVWQKYASPVWMDINQSDTLQRKSAREDKDEKHICPLQLEVIKRCIELWSNPNDIVLDPFAGIGSTPYVALRMGRRGLGVELKESYYNQAVKNCNEALNMSVLHDLDGETE